MPLAGKIKLRANEAVVDIIRPSAANYFWHYLLALIILFANAFFAFWLARQGWYGVFVLSAGAVAAVALLLDARGRTRKNYWVLTTERLVDIEQSGLFERAITAIGLNEARDMRVRKKGIGAFLFGLGDLVIDTRGENYALVLKGVRDAQIVIDRISELAEGAGKEKERPDFRAALKNFYDILPRLSADEIREIRNRLDNKLADLGDDFTG